MNEHVHQCNSVVVSQFLNNSAALQHRRRRYIRLWTYRQYLLVESIQEESLFTSPPSSYSLSLISHDSHLNVCAADFIRAEVSFGSSPKETAFLLCLTCVFFIFQGETWCVRWKIMQKVQSWPWRQILGFFKMNKSKQLGCNCGLFWVLLLSTLKIVILQVLLFRIY